jgi:uncharacterized protein YecT (DUF1311 family)
MKATIPVFLLLLLLLSAAPASAGPARSQWPEGPCAEAGSSRAMEACAERELKAAEAEMKKSYDRLASSMEAPSERASLRAAQRDWVRYRRSNCRSEAFLYRGGTIQELILLRCSARLTRERRAEIEAQLKQYTD